MISISPTLVIYAILTLAVGGYVVHCEGVKSNYEKAQVLAKAQEAENAKQALRDHKAKERSDENYQRNLARLNADVRRLRDSSTSLLPTASPSAPDPDRICFSRLELDTALRTYRAGVLGLLEEGAKAVEGLDEAKNWVKGR